MGRIKGSGTTYSRKYYIDITPSEQIKLRKQAKALGLRSLSDLVRISLNLPLARKLKIPDITIATSDPNIATE